MLKSKSKSTSYRNPYIAGDRKGRPYTINTNAVLILNILTAFKDRVGHAPQGRGALLIIIFIFIFIF